MEDDQRRQPAVLAHSDKQERRKKYIWEKSWLGRRVYLLSKARAVKVHDCPFSLASVGLLLEAAQHKILNIKNVMIFRLRDWGERRVTLDRSNKIITLRTLVWVTLEHDSGWLFLIPSEPRTTGSTSEPNPNPDWNMKTRLTLNQSPTFIWAQACFTATRHCLSELNTLLRAFKWPWNGIVLNKLWCKYTSTHDTLFTAFN